MPTGMYDKIQNLYAGGVAPDVWEPDAARFPAWAERGSFADVTAMARRDQGKGFDLNDVWPNYRKAAEWQGKLHGVLSRFTVNAFFYNQDLFARAGLRAPDDSWTWQTMLDAAKRLTGGEQFGFLMANWNHWVWMAGGEVLTERGGKWRSAMGAPPAVEALQFLSDLRHTHRVWPTTEQMGGLDAIKLFTAGRLAMSDQRVIRVPDVRAAEGELQWDVGPMPRGKAGRFAWGIGVNRCLSSQSKAPEAGWAFLRFLFTKPHIAAISIPPNMSYARSPAFLEPGKQPRHMSAFLDAIAYSKDFPNHQGRWPDLELVVNEELNRLWAGEVTARAAGEAIDQKVNAQLSAWGQLRLTATGGSGTPAVDGVGAQVVQVHLQAQAGLLGDVQVALAHVQGGVDEGVVEVHPGADRLQAVEVGHGQHHVGPGQDVDRARRRRGGRRGRSRPRPGWRSSSAR